MNMSLSRETKQHVLIYVGQKSTKRWCGCTGSVVLTQQHIPPSGGSTSPQFWIFEWVRMQLYRCRRVGDSNYAMFILLVIVSAHFVCLKADAASSGA